MKLVRANYQDQAMTFNEDGWFNATVAATAFGKTPHEWLRLPETRRYLEALLAEESNTGKSLITDGESSNTRFSGISNQPSNPSEVRYLKTKRGNNGGTWLHPDLAVVFARWLDIRFAIWCDRQVRQIIAGNHPHYDHKKARSEAASSFKVMNEALRLVREAQNKASAPYHYSNEARLINFALVGKSAGLDRESLSVEDLSILAKIEIRNAVMIGQGFDYATRKAALTVFAADNRPLVTIAAA